MRQTKSNRIIQPVHDHSKPYPIMICHHPVHGLFRRLKIIEDVILLAQLLETRRKKISKRQNMGDCFQSHNAIVVHGKDQFLMETQKPLRML